MKALYLLSVGFLVTACGKLPQRQASENDEFKCDLVPVNGNGFSRSVDFKITCEAKKQTIRLHNLEVNITERVKVQANKTRRRTQSVGVARPAGSEPVDITPGKPYEATGRVNVQTVGLGGNRDITARASVTYPQDKRSMAEIDQEKINRKDKYSMYVKKDL
jgi:hypothetical protein